MSKKKVLVVEDNPDVMFVLLSAVEAQDYDFVAVEDGNSVVEAVLSEMPNLVIMDIQLPGKSGLEACRELREIPELKGLKIMRVSGHVPKKDIDPLGPGGFDDFLAKPFKVQELLIAAATLMDEPPPNLLNQPAANEQILPDRDDDDPVRLTWN